MPTQFLGVLLHTMAISGLQPSPISAGVFHWNQTEIASHLLATLKAFRFSDDQHEGYRGEWTHTRMSRQSLCFRVLFNFPLYPLA